MAYHGYIPFIKTYLSNLEKPRVLEIGLDTGATTIPVVVFMSRFHKSYRFDGIDIRLQESLKVMLKNIDLNPQQKLNVMESNSLEVLPDMLKSHQKFDLVLLDGDHNYYTVAKELEYLADIVEDGGIIIIDDYHGRWSEQDMWYAERQECSGIEIATQRVQTEKRGVKPAVDEFLDKNPGWSSRVLMAGEPIILLKNVA